MCQEKTTHTILWMEIFRKIEIKKKTSGAAKSEEALGIQVKNGLEFAFLKFFRQETIQTKIPYIMVSCASERAALYASSPPGLTIGIVPFWEGKYVLQIRSQMQPYR